MLDSTTVTYKVYAIVVTIRNQGERLTLNDMRRKTTEDDIIYIKNHYTTMSAQEVALERGMVKGTVVQIARRLGVKKSKEWIAQRARERALDPNHGGRRSHFQKGNVPATKGRPISEWMSPGGIANSAKTRFKKGQRPLSWRPIGSERVNVEGYVEIKVREGLHGWDPKHRVVWAKANGAIPDGYHVRFRDGNGKEIYEGDIVAIAGVIKGYVRYNARYWRHEIAAADEPLGNERIPSGRPEECWMVIGNIHDNPELLKTE